MLMNLALYLTKMNHPNNNHPNNNIGPEEKGRKSRFFLKLSICFLLFFLLAGGIFAAALYWAIVIEPCPEIKESYIESILGRESPVLYRDSEHIISVLFEDTHRQYLKYDRIPKQFVKAIVAAEDSQFFRHFGIDIPGIVRAMIANIMAGRIVQGGSTITQQTAKNIFKRESRTYRAKLKELLFALRLEYHFSKEKILEFYCNQFFVSGNGHGLGVAARYYFDKDVEDLTLLESAFIAGSVKRPNHYNPFTKNSEAAAEKARQRAIKRADYVLDRMYEEGLLEKEQYQKARKDELVFCRGKMSFALNTVVDLVKDALGSPIITKTLDRHGISNISTSGVRIITSVDYDLQQRAIDSLRSNLSRLDVGLRGYERGIVQQEYEALEYKGDNGVQKGHFLFGTITEIKKDKKDDLKIQVDFGAKQTRGYIDKQGMQNVLKAFARWRKNRWSEPDEKDFSTLLAQLHENDKVYVSVRDIGPDGIPVLDLERYPELQGGVLVRHNGMLRAMVGGMENRFFNRAVHARRLMGSTFKPFLFTAALQLGWNTVDMLDNRRNIFVFQGQPYFPRPDHISHNDEVSMSWAGVTSENVAAVWLLYHLTDQLTPPRLHELASGLDLTPRVNGTETESYSHFKQRIRDQYGIIIKRETLEQAAYDRAVSNLEADFLFDNRVKEYNRLKRLPYGLDFEGFLEEIDMVLEEDEELGNGSPDIHEAVVGFSKNRERNEKLSPDEIKELKLRKKILGRNFLALRKVKNALLEYEEYLLKKKLFFSFFSAEKVDLKPAGYFFKNFDDNIVFSLEEENIYQSVSDNQIREQLAALSEPERRAFWNGVLLEGDLDVETFDQVSAQMAREFEKLITKEPYSEEVLQSVHDYRVMVGLQYLRKLGKEVGITSPLEPVLSFPLGSNVVSLLDSVKMYETLVTGYRWDFGGISDTEYDSEETSSGLDLIERIETPEGEVIYSGQASKKEIVDVKTRLMVANILENTVLYGTGRYANEHVRLSSNNQEKENRLNTLDYPVPLLGKTGTANRFTNAAFIGFVPDLEETNKSNLVLKNGCTVGVYVGFDDNRPMVRKSTHITGSAGALPVWSDVAAGVLTSERIGDEIDEVDISFNGLSLHYPEIGQVRVPVLPSQGGAMFKGTENSPSSTTSGAYVLSFGKYGEGGQFEPQRYFDPFWQNSAE